jgi:type VI secretion system secreted protein VgrG
MTDLSDLRPLLGADTSRLVDEVLAFLHSHGEHQHARVLRLHTPLGPDVLMAEEAHISEHIGPAGAERTGHVEGRLGASHFGTRLEVLALSQAAHLQASALLGQPVLLELLTAHSRTALRPFHGHVTRFELLGSDGGLARYRLVVEPFTAFMQHRADAWAYQGLTVQGVVDQLLADYQGQGALLPQVRWELADASAYPALSLYTQHDETDLAFLQRTLQWHGLFAWFEHEGAPGTPTLGQHTLVIADHPGALQPNAQAQVRYTQASAVLPEDSVSRWKAVRRVGPSTLAHASWDYREVQAHQAQADTDGQHAQPMPLRHLDQPGTYAFEKPQQAALAATRQLQAFDAERLRFEGVGTVRTLAPATRFALYDHPRHAGDEFVVLSVHHEARNNLRADAQAGLQHLLGLGTWLSGRSAVRAAAGAQAQAAPVYQARFTAQPAQVPVRPAPQALTTHPPLGGLQTALVVGLQDPLHTDRDGRIKVQFHWQRGAQSSHRLNHPSAAPESSNAPGDDSAGTWVRVAQNWAGANWGAVFQPRLGQEVLVAFLEGDADRPVVVGAAYNGQGMADAQGNEVAQGAVNATGNAPAWFPGEQRQGMHEGHAHTSSLSGFKSQALDTSQSGLGGHNQLVLDDTPGQGRVLAHTSQRQTWLQLGHLLQQHDNQRLAPRGHGLELHTLAQGALRAGSGLHLSTHARSQGTGSPNGQPTDAPEAAQQLRSQAELLKALAANARAHHADLPAEPDAAQLNAHTALQATVRSLSATEQQAGPEGEDSTTEGGGTGRIPTLGRPDLVLNAAADIASLTPAHTVVATGGHSSLTTTGDTNLTAQRHQAWAVKNGIGLFTRGEAKNAARGVQDTGLKMHAASGNVNVQAQSGPFTLSALKSIDLQSTNADVVITAPERIVLNGGGSYVKIEGGNIEIGTTGKASFKASMKELTGGGGASRGSLTMPLAPDVPGWFSGQLDIAELVASAKQTDSLSYTILMPDGSHFKGQTDPQGLTARINSPTPGAAKVLVGDDDWTVHIDSDESIGNGSQ